MGKLLPTQNGGIDKQKTKNHNLLKQISISRNLLGHQKHGRKTSTVTDELLEAQGVEGCD